MTMVFWWWWVLAAVLAGIEILAPGAFFIWLAAAAAGTGFVAFLANGGSGMAWEIQTLIFAVLSIASVIGWFRFVKSRPAKAPSELNRRGDQMVGQRGTIAVAVSNGRGKARIGDTVWTVTGPDMPVGAGVTVTGTDGSVLEVSLSA